MKIIQILLTKIPILNFFSHKKIIQNNFFNKAGLQTYRIKLAEKKYWKRKVNITPDIKPYIDTLYQDGIFVINDFLPKEEFSKLENECLEAIENTPKSFERMDGDNQYSNITFDKLLKYPTIQKVMNMTFIEKLFCAAERRKFKLSNIVRLLEVLTLEKKGEKIDPETKLHEDIFFNSYKAWLYITDVKKENAPFVYVKGSQNNNTANRTKFSYIHSLDKNNMKSRRISDEELKEIGLQPEVFTANKNTLVMANTKGYHCRKYGVQGEKRIAINFSSRFNPYFNYN